MPSTASVMLFPTPALLAEKTGPLTRLKDTGPYTSLCELYDIHAQLLRQDYLCALSEQIDEIRRDLEILNPWSGNSSSLNCYIVQGKKLRYKMLAGGRYQKTIGIELHFDPTPYADVEWHEEKRLMRNNLILLALDSELTQYEVGVILESRPDQLEKGDLVVAMMKGFDASGYPILLNHNVFLEKTFHLVESDPFHFPYMQVVKRLSKESDRFSMWEGNLWPSLGVTDADLFRLSGATEGSPFNFTDEIVRGILPARKPTYMKDDTAATMTYLRRKLRKNLNQSQALALKSILKYRVAVVQGPPGTGKTSLGCKAAQLFVEAKRRMPDVFPGPILVISASNHAVQQFLLRCRDFTDKTVQCCSNKHEWDPVEYGPLQKEHDLASNVEKRDVMKKAEIIGMTTTRGACIKDSLDEMRIKIVIVEEAAEVLEAHVLACIPYLAQHLIQIGDHRQLRPSYAHEQLAKDYNLTLSMFERLVNNGADCPMLDEQRRMRPSIACLVRSVYPNLVDHESTLGRPRVSGVDLAEPVFFMDHGNVETEDGKGYKNVQEAQIAVELANHLLQHYAVNEITILTTYRKQVLLIKQLLKAHPNEAMKELRATTVDSFQGEENTIIILSLVRCNPSGKVGFLRMANRACVALSRAKNGFFMLGNLFCLISSQEPVWLHVNEILLKTRRVAQALPLQCRHGLRFNVKSAEDIRTGCLSCLLCQRERAEENLCKALEATGIRDGDD